VYSQIGTVKLSVKHFILP